MTAGVDVATDAIVLGPVAYTDCPETSGEEVEMVPEPLPELHGAPTVVNNPPNPAWRQLPDVREETETAVVEANVVANLLPSHVRFEEVATGLSPLPTRIEF